MTHYAVKHGHGAAEMELNERFADRHDDENHEGNLSSAKTKENQ